MNRQRRLLLASLLSICVGLALACGGCPSAQESKAKFDEADALWERGDRAGAVSRYKIVYKDRWTKDEEKKDKLLPRIVETELKANNTDEARKWVALGIKDKIEATYTTARAKDLYAEAKKASVDAAKKRAQAEAEARAARGQRQAAEHEAKLKRLAKTKGLEWSVSGTKSGRGGFVSGIVRNENDNKVSGVKITFDLFKGDAKTGTATDKIPSLEAGKKWSFKAPSRGKEFDRYELTELTRN